VRAFLIWLELDVKKLAKRRPQYEKTIPEVYSNEEIAALFAATEELSQTLHRFALAGATVSAQ
jgi:hypothetical protein